VLRSILGAQEFTAAITGLFAGMALAAAVTLRREKYFFLQPVQNSRLVILTLDV